MCSRSDDPSQHERPLARLQGVMSPEDVALALGISTATLRDLGIPHVKLTRSARVYFPNEVVDWLHSRERML